MAPSPRAPCATSTAPSANVFFSNFSKNRGSSGASSPTNTLRSMASQSASAGADEPPSPLGEELMRRACLRATREIKENREWKRANRQAMPSYAIYRV